MNESTARNIRVQDRYDELMRVGRHGHYETMFQVVREEIESMRQQLADHIKREVMLLEFVQKIKEQTPEKPDYWSSCSQCEHNSNEGEDILEALSATADLDGLILCHAKEVAWIDLYKIAPDKMVYATGLKCNDKQSPLYRAWEPK